VPRRIFPASTVTNTTGAALRLTFHADATTGRRETDLWTVDASNNLVERIPNGVIVTDVTGAYSAFAGPDDIDTIYIGANGGTRSAIRATGYVGSSSGAASGYDAGPAEGQAMYMYGHSYTVSPPYYGTTNREWPVLLKNKLRAASLTQYGQSGSRMWEVWLDVLSGSSTSTANSVWPSTRKGLIVLDCETNDMRSQTTVAGGVTGATEFFEECLRGFLAATRSTRIESDAATLAGTWGVSAYTHASGNQAQAASAIGSSATFSSVTIPSGVTTAYVVLYSGASRGYSIEVDGVVVKTGVGISLPTLSTASRQTITPPSPFPYTIPIPVTSGSHTVKVTSTTASFTLDALLIPVANPAPVVIVKDPAPVTTGGSFSYTAPGLAIMAQGKAELDAVIDRLAVEFSNVVTVNPTLTASDFSTVDNLHLNDRGHRKFATAVAAGALLVTDSLGLYAVL
jgi:hypothetical protein